MEDRPGPHIQAVKSYIFSSKNRKRHKCYTWHIQEEDCLGGKGWRVQIHRSGRGADDTQVRHMRVIKVKTETQRTESEDRDHLVLHFHPPPITFLILPLLRRHEDIDSTCNQEKQTSLRLANIGPSARLPLGTGPTLPHHVVPGSLHFQIGGICLPQTRHSTPVPSKLSPPREKSMVLMRVCRVCHGALIPTGDIGVSSSWPLQRLLK